MFELIIFLLDTNQGQREQYNLMVFLRVNIWLFQKSHETVTRSFIFTRDAWLCLTTSDWYFLNTFDHFALSSIGCEFHTSNYSNFCSGFYWYILTSPLSLSVKYKRPSGPTTRPDT